MDDRPISRLNTREIEDRFQESRELSLRRHNEHVIESSKYLVTSPGQLFGGAILVAAAIAFLITLKAVVGP